jgi:hypothetical protein
MNMRGWIWTAVVGLLIIILQLIFPDPVPDAVNNLLSRDNSAFIGFDLVLRAFLFLYCVVGYVTLLIGIVGTFISYRRRNSE